jgi:predicted aminopeptidase
VKNDTEFNEAFATTVEEEGLRRWLEQRGAPGELAAYRRQREREREFIELFSQARDKLADWYASGESPAQMRPKKHAILKQLGVDLGALERRLRVRSPVYDEWIAKGLNNAELTSLATYYDCMPGFERLLAEQGATHGLTGTGGSGQTPSGQTPAQADVDLPRFYAAARTLSKLPRAERHDLLCKKTPPPASQPATRESAQ